MAWSFHRSLAALGLVWLALTCSLGGAKLWAQEPDDEPAATAPQPAHSPADAQSPREPTQADTGEDEADGPVAIIEGEARDLWADVSGVWHYELTTFGDTPLTVRQVVMAIVLLLMGVVMSRALSRTLGQQVLHRLNIDPSASATIQSLFYYLLLFFFALFALKVVNVPLAAFTVLGGAVALGVGFGSQNIINNFISGLILHAERPVKVGDLIQIGDLFGNVEHIGAHSTRVRTGSNLDITVPNSTFLQNNVINFTLSSDKVRTWVEVGVAYGSPVVAVTQLLRRAVLETGRVSKDPPPIILFKDFGTSALVFEVHFWLHMRTMMDRLQVESSVRYQIEQLFRAEGITIAFPQQDVHFDTTAPLQCACSRRHKRQRTPSQPCDERNTTTARA